MSKDSAAAPMHGFVLLPCPFCGSDDVFIERSPDGDADWVECNACLAHGPIPQGLRPTDEEVKKRWNARSDREDAEKWRAMQRSFSRPDQMRNDATPVWDSRNVGQ